MITDSVADYALSCLEIDRNGLDRTDRDILNVLAVKFRGRPVGLETLAASISEESSNIEEVYEPYLLKLGLIDKTTKGRMASPEAFRYLGLPIPENILL